MRNTKTAAERKNSLIDLTIYVPSPPELSHESSDWGLNTFVAGPRPAETIWDIHPGQFGL